MTQSPGQYPSPYPGPYAYPAGYGYDPMQALLAPARRAGMMMIVLGLLMLLFGVCGGLGLLITDDQMMIDQYQRFGIDLGENPQETMRSQRSQSLISSIRMTVLGLPMLILGIPVRTGRRGPITGGIIVTGLALFLVGVEILWAIVQATRNPLALGGICISIIPLSLFTLQLIWLIQARGAEGKVQAMQMQYQQQYWQYAQQQQQMYGQGGTYPNPNLQAPMINPPTMPQAPMPPQPPPPAASGESNEPPKGP